MRYPEKSMPEECANALQKVYGCRPRLRLRRPMETGAPRAHPLCNVVPKSGGTTLVAIHTRRIGLGRQVCWVYRCLRVYLPVTQGHSRRGCSDRRRNGSENPIFVSATKSEQHRENVTIVSSVQWTRSTMRYISRALIEFPKPDVPETDRLARIAVSLQHNRRGVVLRIRRLADIPRVALQLKVILHQHAIEEDRDIRWSF
jgi:hypothetical protein